MVRFMLACVFVLTAYSSLADLSGDSAKMKDCLDSLSSLPIEVRKEYGIPDSLSKEFDGYYDGKGGGGFLIRFYGRYVFRNGNYYFESEEKETCNYPVQENIGCAYSKDDRKFMASGSSMVQRSLKRQFSLIATRIREKLSVFPGHRRSNRSTRTLSRREKRRSGPKTTPVDRQKLYEVLMAKCQFSAMFKQNHQAKRLYIETVDLREKPDSIGRRRTYLSEKAPSASGHIRLIELLNTRIPKTAEVPSGSSDR